MLGIGKKVEKVRLALVDAFRARAMELSTKGESQRAFVLLDIADVVDSIKAEKEEE